MIIWLEIRIMPSVSRSVVSRRLQLFLFNLFDIERLYYFFSFFFLSLSDVLSLVSNTMQWHSGALRLFCLVYYSVGKGRETIGMVSY